MSQSPASPSLSALFTAAWGPGFVGWIFRLAFYGTSVCQTIWYLRVYREDLRYLKALVITLFLLDTLHTCALSHFLWNLLITDRIPRTHYTVQWELPTSVAITGIVIFIVQLFYAVRIWRISGNRVVVWIIVILCFVQIGSTIVVVLEQFYVENLTLDEAVRVLGPTQLGATVACDLMIVTSMVYYLRRKRTGEERTEAILQKIIFYSVNLGLLGCVIAIVALILVELPVGSADEYPGLGLAPGMVLGQCYSNSLLGILNVRRAFRILFRPDETLRLPTINITLESANVDATG